MKAAWMMWLGHSCLLSGKQAGQPRKNGVTALAQKQHEVVAEEARQAKRKGHHRRCLRSDDGHDLGITMIFFRTRKRGMREKKRKERCSMSFAREDIAGLMREAGKGSGWQTGWRVLPLIASPLPGGLVGW